MPTSVSDYRKARTKEVKLPSLLADSITHPVFIVRKPNARALIAFTSSLGLELSEDVEAIKQKYTESLKTKEGQQKVSDSLRELLVSCVVEPKLSLTANDPETLNVDEIDSEDQIKLLETILETTGLTEEEKAKREFFRKPATS